MECEPVLNLERCWNSFGLRLLIVAVMTLFTVYIMAMPGGTPAVDELSELLGGTRYTDAVGHGLGFAAVAAVWYWMLSALLPARAALIATCAVVLMLGALTEFGQFVVPDRGVSKLDLLANWSGALLGATLTWASSRVNLSLLFGVVRA